jgi:hypothetical protein
MTYYLTKDAAAWDALTPDFLKWRSKAAQDGGVELACVPLGEEDANVLPMVSLLRVPPGGSVPATRMIASGSR